MTTDSVQHEKLSAVGSAAIHAVAGSDPATCGCLDCALGRQFWDSAQAAGVLEGAPLDNPAYLPTFLCGGSPAHVEFTSDLAVAEFYADGGRYDRIREAVLAAWPETCRLCDGPVDDLQRFTDTRGRLFCSQICFNGGASS